MISPTASSPSTASETILNDLGVLEERVGMLIAHVETLAAANESLRRDLAASELRNQALAERVAKAKRRIDALLARLAEPAE
jgi:hypothetical protein